MKKNNNISTGLGTVPDPLDRLENYNNEKKRLAQKHKSKQEFLKTVCRKKNKTVIGLNSILTSQNKSYGR